MAKVDFRAESGTVPGAESVSGMPNRHLAATSSRVARSSVHIRGTVPDGLPRATVSQPSTDQSSPRLLRTLGRRFRHGAESSGTAGAGAQAVPAAVSETGQVRMSAGDQGRSDMAAGRVVVTEDGSTGAVAEPGSGGARGTDGPPRYTGGGRGSGRGGDGPGGKGLGGLPAGSGDPGDGGIPHDDQPKQPQVTWREGAARPPTDVRRTAITVPTDQRELRRAAEGVITPDRLSAIEDQEMAAAAYLALVSPELSPNPFAVSNLRSGIDFSSMPKHGEDMQALAETAAAGNEIKTGGHQKAVAAAGYNHTRAGLIVAEDSLTETAQWLSGEKERALAAESAGQVYHTPSEALQERYAILVGSASVVPSLATVRALNEVYIQLAIRSQDKAAGVAPPVLFSLAFSNYIKAKEAERLTDYQDDAAGLAQRRSNVLTHGIRIYRMLAEAATQNGTRQAGLVLDLLESEKAELTGGEAVAAVRDNLPNASAYVAAEAYTRDRALEIRRILNQLKPGSANASEHVGRLADLERTPLADLDQQLVSAQHEAASASSDSYSDTILGGGSRLSRDPEVRRLAKNLRARERDARDDDAHRELIRAQNGFLVAIASGNLRLDELDGNARNLLAGLYRYLENPWNRNEMVGMMVGSGEKAKHRGQIETRIDQAMESIRIHLGLPDPNAHPDAGQAARRDDEQATEPRLASDAAAESGPQEQQVQGEVEPPVLAQAGWANNILTGEFNGAEEARAQEMSTRLADLGIDELVGTGGRWLMAALASGVVSVPDILHRLQALEEMGIRYVVQDEQLALLQGSDNASMRNFYQALGEYTAENTDDPGIILLDRVVNAQELLSAMPDDVLAALGPEATAGDRKKLMQRLMHGLAGVREYLETGSIEMLMDERTTTVSREDFDLIRKLMRIMPHEVVGEAEDVASLRRAWEQPRLSFNPFEPEQEWGPDEEVREIPLNTPPDVLRKRLYNRLSEKEKRNVESGEQRFVLPRITWLFEVADRLGGRVFQSQKPILGGAYLVCILQYQGSTLAVLENPLTGNATYSLPEELAEASWDWVTQHYRKQSVRELGIAIRTVHGATDDMDSHNGRVFEDIDEVLTEVRQARTEREARAGGQNGAQPTI